MAINFNNISDLFIKSEDDSKDIQTKCRVCLQQQEPLIALSEEHTKIYQQITSIKVLNYILIAFYYPFIFIDYRLSTS